MADEAEVCLTNALSETLLTKQVEHCRAAKMTIGPLCLNLLTHTLTCQGRRIDFSLIEWKMFGYLACFIGRAIPRQEFWHKVWGWPADLSHLATTAEQSCFQDIRRKVEEAGAIGLLWRLPEHRYVLFDRMEFPRRVL